MGVGSSAKVPRHCGRHHLFLEPESENFIDMVCCPSEAGCHVLRWGDHKKLFKVKPRLTHSEHTRRYDLFGLDEHGSTSSYPLGYLEKNETHLRAMPGAFFLAQRWHAHAGKLEIVHRTGILHRKKAKPVPTAKDGQSIDFDVHYEAMRDLKTEEEHWNQEFHLSKPGLVMSQGRQGLEQSGDDARAAQVKTAVVELHQNNALVCVAKRQCFENLKRGLHERPYLGVQVRSSIDDITGSLLLLLCIAWCEEAVSPADDRREHFMHVMRHEVTEEGFVHEEEETWDNENPDQRSKAARI